MTMFNEPELEAEFEEVKEQKYQWVMPFLLGLVVALVLSALVAAAFVMKIGPFGSHDRQDKIEASIIDATDGVDQQMADAAMEQAAAAIGLNASGPQPFSIGQLQFGGGALQALNELAGAEASGALKCQPALGGMEGGARAALLQVKCDIAGSGGAADSTPPAAPAATPAPTTANAQTPAAPVAPGKAPASISLTFAAGSITSVVYTAAGVAQPAPAADAPSDQTGPAGGAEILPGFSLPPSAPQPSDDNAASAGGPPAQ